MIDNLIFIVSSYAHDQILLNFSAIAKYLGPRLPPDFTELLAKNGRNLHFQ